MIHRPVVGDRCAAPADGPVVHTHGSVALLLAGRSVMHMGSAWTVQTGDVFLVPEGAPHYRLDHEPSDFVGVGVCMSCLPTAGWGPALRDLFVAVGEGACPVLRPDDADRDELERTLRSLYGEPDAGAPWLIDARLGVLTALLRRATPAAAPRPQDSPIVARALDHIARHALEPLSLVDVARAVGRAPSHLATRVKAETGESVGAWIAHARMAHARELLLRGDDTVDVVAEKVGYSSASHFHRTFRRMHGLAPAAWREAHRQGVAHHGGHLAHRAFGDSAGHGGGHAVAEAHGARAGHAAPAANGGAGAPEVRSSRGAHPAVAKPGRGHSHPAGADSSGHGHGHHGFTDADAMARVLDDPERHAWQRPDDVVGAMELMPTMTVADVGAGTGYFAVRIARALPDGEVIGTDVEPAMVRYLAERAKREGLSNLRAVLATHPGSGLAPDSVDRVLVAHVWHHHTDRAAFARDLAVALRPGGKLFVVDFAVDARRGPPPEMRVPAETVIAELEAAGLTATVSPVDVPDQYVIEARRDP